MVKTLIWSKCQLASLVTLAWSWFWYASMSHWAFMAQLAPPLSPGAVSWWLCGGELRNSASSWSHRTWYSLGGSMLTGSSKPWPSSLSYIGLDYWLAAWMGHRLVLLLGTMLLHGMGLAWSSWSWHQLLDHGTSSFAMLLFSMVVVGLGGTAGSGTSALVSFLA